LEAIMSNEYWFTLGLVWGMGLLSLFLIFTSGLFEKIQLWFISLEVNRRASKTVIASCPRCKGAGCSYCWDMGCVITLKKTAIKLGLSFTDHKGRHFNEL